MSDFPLVPSYPSIELEYEEDSCFTAGYGLSSATSYIVDGHLYSVAIPIVDSETCRTHNKQLESFYATVEYEKLICAGQVGIADTCTGDSGGPLICLSKDGDEIIVGLTSFGPSPCGSGYGLYTKVSDHSQWIESVIKNKENLKEACCPEVILGSNIEELNGVYQQTENIDFYNLTTGDAFAQKAEFNGSVYWFFFNTENRSTSTARIRTNDSFKNFDETCLLQTGDAVKNGAAFDYQIGGITDEWITDDGTISITCSEKDEMSTIVQTTTTIPKTSNTTEKPTTSNPTTNQILTKSTQKSTVVPESNQSIESTSTATGPLTTTPSTVLPTELTTTQTISSTESTTESSAYFYPCVLFLIVLALSL
ncbi:unnamed protein product [Oikopleura dioica]|uniref:Peptidase S1 domain-containing protein n=1 Tax=Oikopleura dioica TaxID=34765 RepID=E4YRN4_OIKDI|nr:unnamed protein product [Oikopleura dioica]